MVGGSKSSYDEMCGVLDLKISNLQDHSNWERKPKAFCTDPLIPFPLFSTASSLSPGKQPAIEFMPKRVLCSCSLVPYAQQMEEANPPMLTNVRRGISKSQIYKTTATQSGN